ncbi:MAG: hypothetical protein IJZ44_02190 [Lachnospiraceae bacterium]|nr:hypothetical protein [Lachnospiraceae bacterium]
MKRILKNEENCRNYNRELSENVSVPNEMRSSISIQDDAEKVSKFKICIELTEYDYENIAEVLISQIRMDTKRGTVLSKYAELLPSRFEGRVILSSSQLGFVQKALCGILEDKLKWMGIHIKELVIKKEEKERLKASVIVEVAYSKVISSVNSKLSKSYGKVINKLGGPVANIVNTTLDSTVKDTLIVNLINGLSNKWCEAMMEYLQKKYALRITLDNLQCQCNGKPEMIMKHRVRGNKGKERNVFK